MARARGMTAASARCMPAMDTLFSRYRNVMLLVAVLFLQLVMLAVQIKRDSDVPLIRVWAVNVITPVEKVASGGIRAVSGVWDNYLDLRNARQENRMLSEEVNRLKLREYQMREQAAEAARLETILQFKQETPSTTVPARVIGSSASETSRVLFIDRGRESGIRRNMAVITPEGIVGKIFRVFHGSSQVLLITDPDAGAGVLLTDSRVQGVLRGAGGYLCKLLYIPNDEKITVGDRVYTTGQDSVYPKGIPAGVVTIAKRGPSYQDITVQPAARLNRLEEVLVVTSGVDQEIPAKPEAAAVADPVVPAAGPGAQQAQPGQQGQATKPVASSPAAGATASAAKKTPEAKVVPVTDDRGETDADRLVQAYREKQAQAAAGKKPATGAAPASPQAQGEDSVRDDTPAPAAKKPATNGQAAPGAGAAQPNGQPLAAAKKSQVSAPVPANGGGSVKRPATVSPAGTQTAPAAGPTGAAAKKPATPDNAAKKTTAPNQPGATPGQAKPPATKKNPANPNPTGEVRPD